MALIVYLRSYPWKAVETMYIYCYYIIITNFATAVAVSAITWSAILRQFTKNYNLFRILPQNASIAGKPIML